MAPDPDSETIIPYAKIPDISQNPAGQYEATIQLACARKNFSASFTLEESGYSRPVKHVDLPECEFLILIVERENFFGYNEKWRVCGTSRLRR